MRRTILDAMIVGLASVAAACTPHERSGTEPAASHQLSRDEALADSELGTYGCSDAPPSAEYSCAQQAAWGKCGEPWMAGYCEVSCGHCAAGGPAPMDTCDDSPPSMDYTCAQQKAWGKCDEPWMVGHCEATCGRCGTPPPEVCADTPPSPNDYTCAQLAAFGKCADPGMQRFCNRSCGRCTGGSPQTQPPSPPPPPPQTQAPPPPEPAPSPPPEEPTTCSLRSDTPARLEIYNYCTQSIGVWWLSFDCSEQFYGNINQGMGFVLDSFTRHSWRFRLSSNGRYLGDVNDLTGPTRVDLCR